jgi:hypothetical protein
MPLIVFVSSNLLQLSTIFHDAPDFPGSKYSLPQIDASPVFDILDDGSLQNFEETRSGLGKAHPTALQTIRKVPNRVSKNSLKTPN